MRNDWTGYQWHKMKSNYSVIGNIRPYSRLPKTVIAVRYLCAQWSFLDMMWWFSGVRRTILIFDFEVFMCVTSVFFDGWLGQFLTCVGQRIELYFSCDNDKIVYKVEYHSLQNVNKKTCKCNMQNKHAGKSIYCTIKSIVSQTLFSQLK